jgi:serine/threonine-protein kinase
MELVDGVPLSERLPESPMSPSEVIEIGAQVAETLAAAHRIGIAHTNISPANVMLTAAGVKILNFGLVEAGSGVHQRESGDVPHNQSDHSAESLEAGAAADMFDLGVMLHACLVGRRPSSADVPETPAPGKHRSDSPPAAASRPPEEVVDVIRRCLASAARERPSAQHVSQTLRAHMPAPTATSVASAGGSSEVAKPARVHRSGKDAARRKVRPIVVVAAALILAALPAAIVAGLGGEGTKPAFVGNQPIVDQPPSAVPTPSASPSIKPSSTSPAPATSTGRPPGTTRAPVRPSKPPVTTRAPEPDDEADGNDGADGANGVAGANGGDGADGGAGADGGGPVPAR